MTDVTEILFAIEQGNPKASEELLPLVYDELRKLAAARLSQEKPGQTLQATALVHDAYVRLVGIQNAAKWDSRGHFFAAAAEAMRRILIDRARVKSRQKRGGDWTRVDLEEFDPIASVGPDQLLQLDEALAELSQRNALASELIKLRYFGGLSLSEASAALKISSATAYRHWAYARAFLRCELLGGDA